jgi:hypothetical protein
MNARMALIIEGLRSERDALVAELERVNGALAVLVGDDVSPEPPAAATTKPKPAGDFRCQVAGCDFEGKNQHSLSMHTTRRHKPKQVASVVKPKPSPVGGAEAWRQAAPAIDPPHRCDDCGQAFVSLANFESHRMHGCDTGAVA